MFIIESEEMRYIVNEVMTRKKNCANIASRGWNLKVNYVGQKE